MYGPPDIIPHVNINEKIKRIAGCITRNPLTERLPIKVTQLGSIPLLKVEWIVIKEKIGIVTKPAIYIADMVFKTIS
ncbi:MAG: hypothetical protein KAJ30_00735, partial [Candidatus Heimdallarchaeota archaeon]|nr:hypothetical protein [Candidatus Heimdallarchaeota archaeon]